VAGAQTRDLVDALVVVGQLAAAARVKAQ